MANPIRVLILEDRQADAELMIAELRRAEFEPQWDLVDTEADFVASLAHAPEIVLADYALPQWDGLAPLRVLQQLIGRPRRAPQRALGLYVAD